MQTLLGVRTFVVLGFLSLLCALPAQVHAQLEIQKKLVIEDEKGIYANWYKAYQQKDMVRALGFANKYLEHCPSGQYVSYMKKYLEKNLPEHPDALRIFATEAMDRVVVEPAEDSVEESKTLIIGNFLEVPKDAVLTESLLLLIIEEGASVDARSRAGYTALMLASLNGNDATVKNLLEKGANINFKEASHGWTPLSFAIANGKAETVRLLLDNGANAHIRDSQGRNALDQAKLTGSAEIIHLFKR